MQVECAKGCGPEGSDGFSTECQTSKREACSIPELRDGFSSACSPEDRDGFSPTRRSQDRDGFSPTRRSKDSAGSPPTRRSKDRDGSWPTRRSQDRDGSSPTRCSEYHDGFSPTRCSEARDGFSLVEPTASPKPCEDQEMVRGCTPRLTPCVPAAAQRQAAQLARTDDLDAARFLHHDAERRKAQAYQQKTGADQFIAAAAGPPTRFKFLTSAFKGPLSEKTRRSQNDSVGYSSLPISSLARIHRWENFFKHDKETSQYLAQDDGQALSGAEYETFDTSWRGLRLITVRHIPLISHTSRTFSKSVFPSHATVVA